MATWTAMVGSLPCTRRRCAWPDWLFMLTVHQWSEDTTRPEVRATLDVKHGHCFTQRWRWNLYNQRNGTQSFSHSIDSDGQVYQNYLFHWISGYHNMAQKCLIIFPFSCLCQEFTVQLLGQSELAHKKTNKLAEDRGTFSSIPAAIPFRMKIFQALRLTCKNPIFLMENQSLGCSSCSCPEAEKWDNFKMGLLCQGCLRA